MPRNRMIKPELCSDGNLGNVSRDARLLFILMLMHSDDYGVITSSERFLLGNCFENDESVTNPMIKKWILELIKFDFIIPFDSENKSWYKIKNWEKHQKVDKPSKRRNPIFEPESSIRRDTRETLNDTLATLSTTKEKEKEESKRESKRERESILFDNFEHFWDHWKINIKNGSVKQDAFKAFKKLSDDELKKAFDNIIPFSKSNSDQKYLVHCCRYLSKSIYQETFKSKARYEISDL